MGEYEGKEKRRHLRIKASFVASYRVGKKLEDCDLTQTRNISNGGMLLTTNREFDQGNQLVIVMRFPFIEQKIEIIGEVVGSREIVKNLIYETRVKFLDLDKEFFKKLGRFVEENLKQ
ncbi:MAG: PilZ domain-containing protein [Candidatus Omnitrophota bacterium]